MVLFLFFLFGERQLQFFCEEIFCEKLLKEGDKMWHKDDARMDKANKNKIMKRQVWN